MGRPAARETVLAKVIAGLTPQFRVARSWAASFATSVGSVACQCAASAASLYQHSGSWATAQRSSK